MSVANSILKTVREESARRGAHVLKVGMRLGELAGVDAGALRFCFDSLVAGSDLEPLDLAIEPRARRHLCPRCEHTFEVVDYSTGCPRCGNAQTEFAGGDELELAYLEVEDP